MKKLLFFLADATMPKVIYNAQEDLELLLGQIYMNRIGGIAYKNLINNKGLNISNEIIKNLKLVYENNLKRNIKYCEDVKYIAQILKDAKFKYALLKGAFLITCLYESGMRTSNDIDILIDEEDLSNCQELLIEHGFIQGFLDDVGELIPATRKDILLARMNFGETIPFVKIYNGEPIVLDLNFSIDYKPEKEKRIVKELLNNSVDVVYEEISFKCLNMNDFIIHLCCHLYKEATIYDWVNRRKDLLLYKFSDLNLIFSRYFDLEQMNILINRINYLGLNKECYYSIYHAGEIYSQLYNLANIQELLVQIRPRDLTYMKEIYDPLNNKMYRYNCSFIEWFELSNRIVALETVDKE